MSLPITTPLPEAREGEPAWILSAELVELMERKIDAFMNMQTEFPLKVIKADSGFKIVGEGVLSRAGLPNDVTPRWIEVQVCVAGTLQNVWIFAGQA